MDQRIQDMCLLAFQEASRYLAIVPFLVSTLAFPVKAETNSGPWTQRTGPASAQARQLHRPPSSPNLATAKAGSNLITPQKPCDAQE